MEYKLLTRSRSPDHVEKFPAVVNIEISLYSSEPSQFWDDRLVDAVGQGDLAKVELCLENGREQICRVESGREIWPRSVSRTVGRSYLSS